MPVQLGHFQRQLERSFYSNNRLPTITSWEEAFALLATQLEERARVAAKHDTSVVFLDELPWLASPRSRLLQALDHVWNTRLSRLENLRLIVCGSAASFMLEKLIHATGGLHNRVTQRLRLDPFSLDEARELLQLRGVRLGDRQILELYLALGGIPHYLMGAQKGRSATQLVGELCFSEEGLLGDEFPRLFESLFRDSESHEAVVRVLAGKRSGMSRGEIALASGLSSGGRLAKRLSALEEAGFVYSLTPLGRRTKDTVYRLIDPYALFYLDWMEPASKRKRRDGGASYWASKATSQRHRAWAKYAFENVCFMHLAAIERALGIEGIGAEIGAWRYLPKPGSKTDGAQVDLVFDRDDGIVTLCEMKHSGEPFSVTKAYARELKRKLEVFADRTKTSKDVQLALVTSHDFKPGIWSDGLVDNVVTLKDLFR